MPPGPVRPVPGAHFCPKGGRQSPEVAAQLLRALLSHNYAPCRSSLDASQFSFGVCGDVDREVLQGRVLLDAREIVKVRRVKVRHDVVQYLGYAKSPGGVRWRAEELDHPALRLHEAEIQDCAIGHLVVLAVPRER